MATHDYLDPDWPPGTVKLQRLSKHEAENKNVEIIFQPRPSDDPNDPLNWPKSQKVVNFFLASFYAMMVFAFISATSPTWGPLADELKFSIETLTNTYAIGSATLALGAPMLIPFALKYGSRPVYVLSSIFQFIISIWAAKTQTAGDWWGVNALQCWLGALAEVLIQITIADMFFVHQRGLMNSIYVWAANIGSNLAVVAAGFITSNQGWRWVWWWCAIFFGVQIIMFVFGFEETKFPSHVRGTPLRGDGVVPASGEAASIKNDRDDSDEGDEKSRNARNSTEDPMRSSSVPLMSNESTSEKDGEGNSSDLTSIHIDPNKRRKTYWQRLSLLRTSPGPWSQFLRHSWQPFLILGSIPGILFCSLTYAILLAWTTVMTTALSVYMLKDPYNFTASQIGLMNLAPFIGQTLGTLVVGPVSDYFALQLTKRNNGIYEPEMRFYVFVPFIPFQLAGAWWFGYALADGKSWVQVAMAFGICNFGSAPLQSIALTYLLDAYNEIIGDALTALTFTRNVLSTIFVFAMPAWIAAVGIPNVFNTIGAIGVLILSFSVFFIWRGKKLRAQTAKVYKYYAERQFEARPV
ncbi:hypothetical protein CkaCkLH20_07430 [Colletotrichum karsti]|uniref:MFS-type transporter n=1 Tax=Colletotrichum karsti TaxID=1095194 RepID=A0A9P6I2Q3_9PEZI|nr:uncharacterized protein CkaCkLH20_07430 [Colletotrichum karsti]KAF9875164.1 hypothetical protein CkaCkLH20_07430 [Colletotrichum karsti]